MRISAWIVGSLALSLGLVPAESAEKMDVPERSASSGELIVDSQIASYSSEEKKDELVKHWKTLKGHKGTVLCVAISPDGKKVASGGEDGIIRIWDVQKGVEIATLEAKPYTIFNLAFFPNGRTLISNGAHLTENRDAGQLVWWDLATNKATKRKDFPTPLTCLALSPDGKKLATSSDYIQNSDLQVRNAETGMEITAFSGGKRVPYMATFSHDGKLLSMVSCDNIIRLWELESKKELFSAKLSDTSAVRFTQNRTKLIMGFGSSQLIVHDIASAKTIKTIRVLCGRPQCLLVSPTGNLAFSSYKKDVFISNVMTGEVQMNFTAHRTEIICMALSADGTMLVTSGGDDMTVKLWRINESARSKDK